MKKRILCIGFALIVLLSGKVSANTIYTQKEIDNYIYKCATRQMSTVTNPGNQSIGGEWTVMGLAKSGYITKDYANIYLDNLLNKLESTNGVLSTQKYTEYSRVVIALTSLGYDASSFCGYNLVKPLGEADKVKGQGLNGVAYALIALECGDYANPKVPADYTGKIGTRSSYKESLVKAARANGGWTLMGQNADVDMTGIVIQALAPYYTKDSEVQKEINKALHFLSESQMDNGGFATVGKETCESSAQAIVALSSVGVKLNDDRFIKKGNNVLDGLLRYYIEESGGFAHLLNGKCNQMATDQAMYALVASKIMAEKESSAGTIKPFYDLVKHKAKGKKLKKINKKTLKKQIKKTKAKIKKQKRAVSSKNIQPVTAAINSATVTKHKKHKKHKKAKKETTVITSSISTTVVATEHNNKKVTSKKKEASKTNILLPLIVIWIIMVVGGIVFFKKSGGKNV